MTAPEIPDAVVLAVALVEENDIDRVLAAIDVGGATMGAAVSAVAAELIIERAARPAAMTPADCDWDRCQRGFMRLASAPGADAEMLATGLLTAAVRQVTSAANTLDPDVAMWLLATIPASMREVMLTDDWRVRTELELSALELACFRATGRPAADWFVELLRHDSSRYNGTYQTVQSGRYPRWPDHDWALRFEAIAQSELPVPGFFSYLFVGDPPPRAAAPAYSHVIVTRVTDPTDPHFQQAIEFFKAWRTGDPVEDARLFWWPTDEPHVASVRHLLECSGEPGSANAVLDAAHTAGLLDGSIKLRFVDEVQRPARSDGEVAWAIDPHSEDHWIELPAGRLAIGDPVWGDDHDAPVEIAVPPGSYLVRVIGATHPLQPRCNVAVETIIDATQLPVRWHQAPGLGNGQFTAQNGLAVTGASTFCTDGGVADLDYDYEQLDAVLVVEHEGEGTGVVCRVAPQLHQVRSWTGQDGDGNLVRIVSELGILNDLDPTQSPLPWTR